MRKLPLSGPVAAPHPQSSILSVLKVCEMKNFVQPGNRITVPAPAPVKGGEVVIIGELAGIAFGDAAAGEPVDLALNGVFDLPKVAADAITVGDAVYYDATAKLVTGD